MSSQKRIGILVGGAGVERQQSLRTAEAVTGVVARLGHTAVTVFVDRDLDLALRQAPIETAFLAVRGRYAIDGCLQGLLELRGIAYTGSGVLASALSLDRVKMREVLRLQNLPTAAAWVHDLRSDSSVIDRHGSFGFPVWVHPVGVAQGLGVGLARDELELESAVEQAGRFSDRVSIERFVAGRVVHVAVLEGRALGAVDIGAADEPRIGLGREPAPSESPAKARLTMARYRSVLRLAELTYEAAGAEGAATVELVMSERFNEVIGAFDPAPSLLPSGSFVRTAARAGIPYSELVRTILEGARLRAHGQRSERRTLELAFEGGERRAGAPQAAH
jgi:D-alanine-D-alanine ligase